MSTKRLSLSIIAGAATALLGCAGNEGAAGSQTGRVEAPITAQSVAPSAVAAASPLGAKRAPEAAAVQVAKTPMPKAALPVAAAPVAAAPVAAAPVAAAPVAAAPAPVAPAADGLAAKSKDSKYLSPVERLRVVGLAVETACLPLKFGFDQVASAHARLHAAAGVSQEELARHLPYFFGEYEASEAIGNTRKLCEPSQTLPVAPELAKEDEALLQTLLAATVGNEGGSRAVVVDETTYIRTIERLRTAEDFRKAFVARSLESLEVSAAPGGPAAERLPQDDPPAGGCTSDKDCKGDRICVDNKCVPPPGETAPPTDPKPEDPKPTEPTTPNVAAETIRFEGRLGSDGSFSFRLKGKTISGGTANVKGRTFSLKSGGIKGAGQFMLNGNSGGNFVRIHGTYTSGKKWVKGTYDGTIDKQKVGGSFSASGR